MSKILHHYKILKERTSSFIGFYNFSKDNDDDNIYDYNSNHSKISNQEIDKWYNFSFILRKKNRMLFKEMLQSSYKNSSSINAKEKKILQNHYL